MKQEYNHSKKKTNLLNLNICKALPLCILTVFFIPETVFSAGPAATSNIKDSTTNEKESSEERQKALKELRKRIRYSFSTDRRQAIQSLRKLKDEEIEQFYDLLIKIGGEDSDYQVRTACIRFLADRRVEKAKDLFIETIKHKNEDAAREALRGISRTSHKPAANDVFVQLKERELTENDTLTIAMIRTLGDLQSQLAVDMLIAAIEKPETHSEIRRAATLYFGSVKASSASVKLKELMLDPNEDITVRAYAANSIGKLENKSMVADLKNALEEIREIRNSRERARYNNLKQQAIVALVRLGDESVKEELYAAAKDDDPNVRVRAIKHMGELQLEEFREFLEYKSENDESRSVMATAKTALNKLDGIEDDSAELEVEQEDENQ